MDDLLERWVSFWTRLGATGNIRLEGARVLGRYDELWRRHHGRGHVRELYGLFDEYRHLARDPDAVEAAIPFHDAVYELRSATNEEDSAALAREVIGRFDLPRLIEPVSGITLASKHLVPPTDSDQAFFCGLDTAVLGMDRPRYIRYADEIRAEYEQIYTPIEFCVGRQVFLSGYLQREQFYATPELRARFEGQVRGNLEWEIAMLRERKTRLDLAR